MPDEEWLEHQRELEEQREREEEERRLLEEEYRQQQGGEAAAGLGPGPSRASRSPGSVGPPPPQVRNPLGQLLQGCGCVSRFGCLIAVLVVILLGFALALLPMDSFLGRDNPCGTDTLLACAQGFYAEVAAILT